MDEVNEKLFYPNGIYLYEYKLCFLFFRGKNNQTKLMYGTSLFDLKAELPSSIHKHELYGLNMYTLEEALVYASPSYFRSSEITARICLSMVKDVSVIIRILSNNGASSRAPKDILRVV